MNEGSVAVIVPAYLEERLIVKTISHLPPLVGQIIVVDDASPDKTVERARSVEDDRIVVVRHKDNQGVGAAIFTGYRTALLGPCSVFVVMAGDNQMDPNDLPALTAPVLRQEADYVKGNRLAHARATDMPLHRRIGTDLLARVTSLAGGQKLSDSQCGYTAISRRAAAEIEWSALWPRYGYPNDVLLTLLSRGYRVLERPVRPVYADEKSGLRVWHFFSILRVILRRAYLERTVASARGALLTTAHGTNESGVQPAGAPFNAEDPAFSARKDERSVPVPL